MIGGYGFGDVHINRALQNRLVRTTARPPIMVLTKSHPKTDPMQFGGGIWGLDLCKTLNVSGDSFAEPDYHVPPQIADIIDKKTFEVSSRYRVAIWHDGFIEAVDRLDSVLPWLDNRATDMALAPSSTP